MLLQVLHLDFTFLFQLPSCTSIPPAAGPLMYTVQLLCNCQVPGTV